MARLIFCVPAHGRFDLTRVCLRQLRRTCDALAPMGIQASAIVVGDDDNLETARGLGFGTVRRDNDYLSRRFNDGIQLACDPAFNPRPAHFVVPFGSDDWAVPELFATLPSADSVVAFRHASFVNEDRTELVHRVIGYEAGVGIRIYPAAMMRRLDYRPADEDRKRACDTSILVNIKNSYRPQSKPTIFYADRHEYQVVDWKSRAEQLNAYEVLHDRFPGSAPVDPFEALALHYPAESLEEMRALGGSA